MDKLDLEILSYEKWEEERKNWKQKHPVLYFLQHEVYYPLVRFKDRILQIPQDIKYFYQRGTRGWADCDCWCWYGYNARINYQALQWIKKHKQGIPSNCLPEITELRNHTDEEFIEGEKKWNDILDEMIYAFKCLMEASDGDLELFFPSLNDPKKHYLADNGLMLNSRLMTFEENERMARGLQLYIEHLQSLWD